MRMYQEPGTRRILLLRLTRRPVTGGTMSNAASQEMTLMESQGVTLIG